ncbi:MAG: hypothetical protein AAFQ36_02090 [Pseudomonadota bacterium]
MTLRRMHEAKAGDTTIQLFGDDAGVPEMFVEGIHGIRFAGTHVKMNLYTVAEQEPNLEQRQLVARLVMPIGSYLDMAAMIAGHAQGVQQNIAAGQAKAEANGAAPDETTTPSAE